MKSILKIAAIAIAVGIAATASAQDETVAAQDSTVSVQNWKNWSLKAGINRITPAVQSDDMTAPSLPGTKVDVGSDTQPILSVAYAYNSNWSTELVLGTPYKHDISGAGAIAGVGKAGSVEVLPPTIFGQYRFLEEQSMFRPYAGLGLTYAYFQNATGSGALTALTNTGSSTPTTFSVDPAWGPSIQAGVNYRIDDKWFADFALVKTYLKTRAHYSTGQTIDMRLDPLSVSLSLGYHF